MIPNPFSIFDSRLDRIENLLIEIRERSSSDNSQRTPDDKFISAQEAADFLGLALQTIYGLVYRKIIPHFKRNKRLYFNEQELKNWIKVTRKQTIEEAEIEMSGYLKNKKSKSCRK